jgi:hypothetical protein
MSYAGDDTDHKIEVEDILLDILQQLKLMNALLFEVHQIEINKDDVE